MIYKKPAPPNTPLCSITYCFLTPTVLTIKNANGTISQLRFGIGEKIDVLEPSVQYLVATHENLEQIPLVDGSWIVEYPDDIRVVREI